jgi:hypothetical protein
MTTTITLQLKAKALAANLDGTPPTPSLAGHLSARPHPATLKAMPASQRR